ncbi:eCIS core domain-containing protein [Mesobacterium pallidum]|uniref:eCIS core domain-containing protein n=1 Tax=Mesobacterium pallidum TaxID=2872037 RepID=UPI001EE2C711|nr:DUF4157 domain-containing protein [Mesobacterium pallidum]
MKTRAQATPKVPRRAPPVRRVEPAMRLVQPSLRVGAVNDPAEREAEAMAARVVGASAPRVAANHTPTDVSKPAARLLRAVEDQPTTDELVPEPVSADQAEFDLPKTEDVTTEKLGGEDMAEIESGRPQDTAGDPPPLKEEPPPVLPPLMPMRGEAVVGRSGGAAPSDVAQLVAQPGPGRPLSRAARARIEPHFGTSFEDVRLHDSPADQQAAARIGARAFTHRNHVWLGRGETETNTGLMAHELTHVVQQTRGAETLPLNRAPVIRREGWFTGKAERAARHVPGYTLITVIIGRKLISGDRVDRTATNLLGGLFGLVPGGTVIFDRLKEARVLEEAYAWVTGQLTELNLTWSRFQSTIDALYDGLISLSPVANAKRILGAVVRDILTFVKRITAKVLEFIVRGALKLAGPYADKVWGIIQQAGNVLNLILEDPLGFAKNLVRAVVGGFAKFGRNILTHLKNGLLGWLFGALGSAGIQLPARFDFKGLMSLVMQILGLTYEAFRKRLVKALGPKGEKQVALIEKSVEIVKVLLKEGFAGIWKKMLELIEGFKQTLIGGMTTMVIQTVIRAGLGWLAGLSNPVGALIKVVLAIYDMIVAFLERLEQIMDVAKSIFSSVGAIARGQVTQAVDFVEQTIGRTVPVVISFLAAVLGLGGISGKIRDVIKKLQKPVKTAMDKLLKFVVKKAKKLLSKLIAKLNGKRKLPSVNFKIGRKSHRIFGARKGRKVEVQIASKPAAIELVHRYTKAELKKLQKLSDKKAPKVAGQIEATVKKTDTDVQDEEAKLKPDSTSENQLPHIKSLQRELEEAANEFGIAQQGIGEIPFLIEFSGDDNPALFRASEPRDLEFEGKAALHGDMDKDMDLPITGTTGNKRSDFYERDHVVEKQYPKYILDNLKMLDAKDSVDSRPEGDLNTPATRAERNTANDRPSETTVYREDSAALERLGQKSEKEKIVPGAGKRIVNLEKIGDAGRELPAIALYRTNHDPQKVSPLGNPKDIVAAAVKEPPATRHDHLRTALRKQFDHEVGLIRTVTKADKAVPAEVKTKVEAGLKTLLTSNVNLYGFDAKPLGNVVHKAPRMLAGDAKFGPSDAPMAGSAHAPNFLEIEGKGGKYDPGAKSARGHLESDHVIDKTWPINAKAERLLRDGDSAAVRKKAEDLRVAKGKTRALSKGQAARLDALTRQPFLDPALAMSSYSEHKGYAIPIYFTIAKRVTARVNAGDKGVIATLDARRAEVQDDLARHVVEGNTGPGVAQIQASLAGKVKSAFQGQSKLHEGAIADEYRADIQRVTALHPPQAQPLAKRQMLAIAQNVYNSLNKANQKTNALFSNGSYSAD